MIVSPEINSFINTIFDLFVRNVNVNYWRTELSHNPIFVVNGIAFTKLDVLDGFETLKICVAYELDGARLDYLPTAADQQARCTPIYEEMPGWSESTEGARSWAELPANAIKYVRRVEELIDCSVALLSTSPERDDTILVTDPFED